MPLSIQDWHQRFIQQAHWTGSLRQYIYKHTQLLDAQRILEVGSGTGVIISSCRSVLASDHSNQLYGIDINGSYLRFSRNLSPDIILTQGNGHHLPYSNESFDATICHFLLLWVTEPDRILREMKRVTRSNGFVIAFAEPDYGGRIDYPDELIEIGQFQAQSLKQQGADPDIGRKLAASFSSAGLNIIEFGVLGGQWGVTDKVPADNSEWAIIQSDLKDLISKHRMEQLQQLDYQARSSGERVLYVPTFYAFGRVSEN